MSETGGAAPRQIGEGAWRVPLPLPWKLNSVNAFLFRRRDGWLLLDCGLNVPETFTALESALRSLRLDWRSITKIWVSHAHPDHVGAAAQLRRLSGAPIAMHPTEAALVAPRASGNAFFTETAAYLRRHGAPEDLVAAVRGHAEQLTSLVERLVPDEELNPGDALDYEGGRLETLLTPGHSPAMLSFHDPVNRVYYSTDLMLERVTPNIGVHPFYGGNPLGEYLDSLAAAEGLAVERVAPSHGDLFGDHRGWIAAAKTHHRDRLEAAGAAVRGRALSAHGVAGEIWGVKASPAARRFALAEALAHLEFLARLGRVERLESSDVLLWRGLS